MKCPTGSLFGFVSLGGLLGYGMLGFLYYDLSNEDAEFFASDSPIEHLDTRPIGTLDH